MLTTDGTEFGLTLRSPSPGSTAEHGAGDTGDNRPPSDACSAEAIMASLESVRERKPLIHNITNLVVQNTTANALLAIGASPAMVVSPHEVEEFVSLASALVVNLGSMVGDWPASMRLATKQAAAIGTPWVLDPVAAGAISFRTRLGVDLLKNRPAAIRGNATEIMALAAAVPGCMDDAPTPSGRGVDSVHASDVAIDAAQRLARQLGGAAVAVTGEIDYITNGETTFAVANGHPMMPYVTGLGCSATAVVGAFIGTQLTSVPPVAAVAHAMTVFGVAGEVAAEHACGPGSLQMHLLDALYNMNHETLKERGRLNIQ